MRPLADSPSAAITAPTTDSRTWSRISAVTCRAASIVYHQWLGWHYSFYMFDFPYQFQYYATPEELTAHAAAHAGSPRFVAFPSWTSSTQVAWRLKQAGLILRPIYDTYRDDGSASFTLYRIEEAAP